MSEMAPAFIAYLCDLQQRDRGALAQLKRSLGFAPGAYPPAYPYVERFVGADKHAEDPWRKALYLTAGLYALHPSHQSGQSLASALGQLGRSRGSASVEQRFIALLGAEAHSLPTLLRSALSLLAADGHACDFAQLLADLTRWLNPHAIEARERLCQQWARDFYRAYDPPEKQTPDPAADTRPNQSTTEDTP